jgi:hypothetical protein
MLQHGAAGFTYLPKEVMIRILIALKNPLFLAGFEPANLGTGSLNKEKKNPYTGRQYGSQPRYRRLSHKIGRKQYKIGKNGRDFLRKPRSDKGCSAIDDDLVTFGLPLTIPTADSLATSAHVTKAVSTFRGTVALCTVSLYCTQCLFSTNAHYRDEPSQG